MGKVSNRYLNLTGAPWGPNSTNRATMISNYFGIVVSGVVISVAAELNPHIAENQLNHLFEGLGGAALAVHFARSTRRKEAEFFSSRHQTLVIDTTPDKSTPPTSSDILGRVINKKMQYQNDGFLAIRSLKWGGLSLSLGLTDFTRVILEGPDSPGAGPHLLSFFGGYFLIQGLDILSRYRQLKKISDLQWVISDQGDAVRQFQKEEVRNLAVAKAYIPPQ